MRNPAVRFALLFVGGLVLFSLLLRTETVTDLIVAPLTVGITRVSSVLLNLIGLRNTAFGTIISGQSGFAVNILDGCNGVYVMSIVASAVLAFPSTWKEKLMGLAIGVTGVQAVNLVRILTLYFIGLRNPELFERFHYYVWQSIVIILSMGIWIFWAEVLVAAPRTAPAGGRGHGRA